MKKAAILLFLVAVAGEIISQFSGSAGIQNISKPLIMITLGFYYYAHATRRALSVWLAIVFSLVGDIALQFEWISNSFFIVGLSAFLVAHVCYIISYRQHQNDSKKKALNGIQKIRLAFPIVLAGTGLIVILYPSLGNLKIPVLIYALVLIIMVVNAILRYGRTTNQSFGMVLSGSILFMISDALLAINKFLSPLPAANVWIMSTYILAQFLIIDGLCKHKDF